MMSRYFWLPVTVVSTGFLRIKADTPEDAVQLLEEGNFYQDELIEMNIESVESTGAPSREEATS